jgi:hypothetical protein
MITAGIKKILLETSAGIPHDAEKAKMLKMAEEMEGVDGDLQSQSIGMINILGNYEKYESTAPIGFPLMFGSEKLSLLQWLDNSGVYPRGEQSKTFLDNVMVNSKLTKNEQKKIHKNWSTDFYKDPSDIGTMFTRTLMHPQARNSIGKSIRSVDGWRHSPIGCFIKASHRFLDWEVPTTYQHFVDVYRSWTPPEESFQAYFATQLWETSVYLTADEVSGMDDKTEQSVMELGAALDAFLYRLLIAANRWDDLSDKARNGIMLGAFSAASYLQSKVILMPFSIVVPEFSERVDMDNISGLGLCDKTGQPTTLVRLALFSSRMREHHQSDSAFEFTVRSLSPLSRKLDDILDDTSTVRRELSEYRTAYLAQYIARVNLIIDTLQQSLSKLTPDCEPVVKAFSENAYAWFSLMGLEYIEESGLVAHQAFETSEKSETVLREFWQKSFLERIALLEEQTVTDWLDELDLAGLKWHKEQAAIAIEKMDTDMLATIAVSLNKKKTEILEAVKAFTAPLFLTDEMREVASKHVGGMTLDNVVMATELYNTEQSALHAEIDELRQLNELHITQEIALEKQVKDLSAELHNKTQAKESESLASLDIELGSERLVSADFLRILNGTGSLECALNLTKNVFGDNVTIMPSAYKSIEGCGYKNIGKVVEALFKLCGDYYNAVMVEKKPDATARLCLGSLYKAGESDTTMANPKLAKLRTFRVNNASSNRDYTFVQHLTLGVKRGDQTCLQIHFKLIHGVMMIARVGSHLETATS